ncbi:MAG: hypothetical protein HQK88_12140 [Nitrospirae bacterium]|nr:hypothetical protein [Nitrospirota bacterium]MBF0535726.1 hypothetical protein [Nitrospirota bacterium]MBF0617551.1 hypothetical protein [Nitrospirota bacterium]
MFISYFQQLFGEDPKKFNTVEEIDSFIEKKKGLKLKVEFLYPDIVSVRGSVFPVKEMDVNKIIDNALR